MSIVDLFAGPGGWCVAARELGMEPLGIEWDDAACATRQAAGLLTVQADVASLDPQAYGPVEGLIASPPCQAWSMAGKRGGEADKHMVYACADELAAGDDFRKTYADLCDDRRSLLVVEPVRWVNALRPEWVALEQVPPVLELWVHFAFLFRSWGYRTWTGIVNAANYGVPQTRQRAILLARLNGPVAPPEPTHCRDGSEPSMFGPGLLPWVSMAEALGWGASERPSMSVCSGGTATGGAEPFGNGARQGLVREQEAGRWVRRERSGDRSEEGFDPQEVPNQTLTSKARSWTLHTNRDQQPDGTRQTVETTEPAPSFTAKSGGQWQLRMNSQANATTRSLDEPAGTIFTGHHMNDISWVNERPATTVMGDSRIFQPGGHHTPGAQSENSIRITVQEAAVLQSFAPDYPWQGSRTKQFEQIGNAIPPRLARHLLAAVTGLESEVAA